MRVPQYDSKVRVSSRQFQYAGPTADPLEALGEGISQVKDVLDKKKEIQRKNEEYTATATAENELNKKYAELNQAIENGGDYSKAKAEYDKTYKSVTDRVGGMYGDESERNRKLVDFERVALEHSIRLDNSIGQRVRKEAISAADANEESIMQQWASAKTDDERNALAKRASSVNVGLEGAGAIPRGEGKNRVKNFVQKAEAMRIKLLAQDDPLAAEAEIERVRGNLDPEQYVSMRGSIKSAVEEVGSVDRTVSYIASGGTSEPVRQRDVDITFNREIASNGNLTTEDYQRQTTQLINGTGIVPTGFKRQASSYLSNYKENMTDGDIQTVVANANIVSNIGYTGESGFTKETVSKANLIQQRMDAGMSQREAVERTLQQASNPQVKEMYNAASKEAAKILATGSGRVFDTDLDNIYDSIGIPDNGNSAFVNRDFADAYAVARANGADKGEAKQIASKQLSSIYGEFDGEAVRLPPTKVTRFNDIDSWKKVARAKAIEHIPSLPNSAKVILSGDDITARQRAAGLPDTELSFPVIIINDGLQMPLMDRNGKVVRVQADPKLVKKENPNNPFSFR